MKRVIVFILLKLAEISALVFVPYGVGRLIAPLNPLKDDSSLEFWLSGFLVFTIGGMLLIVVFVFIPQAVSGNWDWAGKITGDKE